LRGVESGVTFETVDGLCARFPWLSRRVVHGLASERRIPHRRMQNQRPLLFVVEEVEAWFDNPALELEVIELEGNGRIVRPKGMA
jgi:hypothetical protein